MLWVVDQELSAKLESELEMEKDMRDSEELPESIRDYLDNGPFEVRQLTWQTRRPFADEPCSYTILPVKRKSSSPGSLVMKSTSLYVYVAKLSADKRP